MGNIPIDIAFDILCRSPAKSVARFASVSKDWASFLSDPNFGKLHCNHQLQNLKLVARHGRLYSLDLDSLDCAFRIDYLLKDSDFTVNKVLGLSDHLLCLSVSSVSNPTLDVIVICNLSTGARHIVPVDSHSYSYNMHTRSHRSFGFGFDPSGDDYKLVRITHCYYESPNKVYSMKTKSWTMINKSTFRFRVASKEPVALDGVLYWVAADSYRIGFDDRHNLIVAFDLARGSFRQVPMPLCAIGNNCLLSSLRGKLCLVCDMSDPHEDLRFYKMEAYEMCRHEHSVSWTTFASFRRCITFRYDQALTFSKNGDKVLVKKREDEFIRFDLAGETISTGGVHFYPMKEQKRKRVE